MKEELRRVKFEGWNRQTSIIMLFFEANPELFIFDLYLSTYI